MWFFRQVTSHTNFIKHCWFTFALFHKEWQENHPEQSLLKISMAGAAETDPAVTSGCSKPRHALKQEVYSVQHKCLFLYDPKWNSVGLTREPCSASCTALLSKVFQKGSQVLRQVSNSKLKVIEFPRNLWIRRVTAGVQAFVNHTK